MQKRERETNKATKRYAFTLALVWTIVVAGFLAWNIVQVKKNTREQAVLQSRVGYQRDVLYRAWNSQHNGVYVPVTDDTPPNPYLFGIPERDITTPSGKRLTLVNPAYMSRQVYELAEREYGIIGHLTGLFLIRPENAPDQWERKALQALQQGKSEVSSVEEIKGKAYMRMMRPLFTEKSCLGCHAAYGFKEGDFRGGISVSVPMEPLWAIERTSLLQMFFGYGAVWLMGLLGPVLVARRLGKSHQEVLHSNRFTENIVATVPSGLLVIGEPDRQPQQVVHKELWESSEGVRSDIPPAKLISVNRSFCELFTVRQQDVVGQPVEAVLCAIGLSQQCRDAVAARKPFRNLECLCSTPGKGEMALNLTLSEIRVAEEEALLVIDDITERKRAEEKLEQTEAKRRELEKELVQSQKLESLGTLAGGIAHDFNNILGIILGHSSLMESFKLDPDELSSSIQAIIRATQRGASLVNQLLTFARKTEAIFQPVNINGIIAEVNKLIRETFRKTITISTSVQPELPFIIADATQIHQVLVNLYVNARDAMPKGGTLSISTNTVEGGAISTRFPKATARQYVQLEVGDTGIGMDEATRERIFEPFFTTKGIGKGTGLGLSVVFGIIENHNGFIDVQSAPGKGASFTVYLPIPEHTPEVSQQTRQTFEDKPGGTETILLIEDEEMLRGFLKTVLVSKGYTVLTAEDGLSGIEMYQSHQNEIAVVFLDLGLPVVSGQDVFRSMREINPVAKIILASGFIEPDTKSEMYKAGLKAFVQKPYLPDEVLQKVREVIDTQK